MNLYTNIPEVLQKLTALREAVAAAASGDGGIQDALVGALNSGRGLMKRRIFNQGEDATGKALGKYKSKPYEEKRIRAGRQVAKKDLQFSGSLASSIETVKGEGAKVVIQISNAENAKIARYQEAQLKTDIFMLSEEEFEAVKTQGNRLIEEIIKSKMV